MSSGPPAVLGERSLRVVLDTNVLVSLFVFADSRLVLLRQRLEAGEWRALTSEACLGEFKRVLAYPQFGLGEEAQASALKAYEGLAEQVTELPAQRAPLPECQDRDDQKFLELARDGGAECLVTSDKALLKLARRGRLAKLFRILTPEAALG
jgi:putative PIN family toxin of toxin-antitoxin system